jgi:hypothetical protein
MKIRTINVGLFILFIISIFLIFWVDFGLIPSFKVDFSEYRIDRINNLISNLSIGYLISVLFYFLLVFLPNYFELKKLIKAYRSEINQIILFAEEIIIILNYFRKKEDNVINIKNIPINVYSKFNISHLNEDEPFTKPIKVSKPVFEHLKIRRAIIKSNMEILYKVPNIANPNTALINALSNINTSSLLFVLETYEETKIEDEININYGLIKTMAEQINSLKKIVKFDEKKRMMILCEIN